LIFDFPLVEDLRCFRGGGGADVSSGEGGRGLTIDAGGVKFKFDGPASTSGITSTSGETVTAETESSGGSAGDKGGGISRTCQVPGIRAIGKSHVAVSITP
jgi:hypothetical protein